ncbi:hypothetical protein HDU96_001380 [Phlyctochytrium bullatum]|nr:hypothetical protein HDU96_001380 [Phlyctochytrium bullatum]
MDSDSDEDEDEDEDEQDDSGEDSGEDEENNKNSQELKQTPLSLEEVNAKQDYTVDLEPQVGDTNLKSYFLRTSAFWAFEVRKGIEAENLSSKGIRRIAFERAQKAYSDALPRLMEEWELLEENDIVAGDTVRDPPQGGESRSKRF